MKNLLKVLMLIMVMAILAGCSAENENSTWLTSVITNGHSMEPTIKEGTWILSVKTKHINRGDVVTIDNDSGFLTENGSTWINPVFIKRAVAVPGDTVESVDGVVKINGVTYIGNTENFSNSLKQTFTITLGENEYFVIGDNFANSNDSRAWKNKVVPGDSISKAIIY